MALLIPLWVNMWGSQPFDPAKAALLRTLVWAMAGAWLAAGVFTRSLWQRTRRRNPLIVPALALAAWMGIATLTSIDPRLSFYGSHVRAQGLLTQASYVVLFLLVAGRLRGPSQVQRLMGTMVAGGVPLIILAAAQRAGHDPLGLLWKLFTSTAASYAAGGAGRRGRG